MEVSKFFDNFFYSATVEFMKRNILRLMLISSSVFILSGCNLSDKIQATVINRDTNREETSYVPTDVSDFENKAYEDDEGNLLNFRLLRPLEPEEGKSYPTVVVFPDGPNDQALDNLFSDTEFRTNKQMYVVIPELLPTSTDEELYLLAGLLDELDLYYQNLNYEKIYLFGNRSGVATGANYLGSNSDFIAASVFLVSRLSNINLSPQQIKKISNQPSWIFGFDGDVNSGAPGGNLQIQLRPQNTALKATFYPGTPEEALARTFANELMWKWLFTK